MVRSERRGRRECLRRRRWEEATGAELGGEAVRRLRMLSRRSTDTSRAFAPFAFFLRTGVIDAGFVCARLVCFSQLILAAALCPWCAVNFSLAACGCRLILILQIIMQDVLRV